MTSVVKELRVLEPRQPGVRERALEAWRYRRLVSYFGRTYIEKTYKKTWLGWIWVPLRPVLNVGTRVAVFGGLLGAPSSGKPYLLFFLVGTSAWQLFSQTALWSTRSIELSRRVLKRVYVPRLTVFVAALAPSMLNFLLYLLLTIVMVVYYVAVAGVFHLELGVRTMLTLAGLVLAVGIAFSIGLWLSIFAALARDVRFGLSYVLGVWFFVTPVIYPLSAVPERFQTAASLNPLTAPIEMVRAGLLGVGEVPPVALSVTLVFIGLVGISGLWFFNRSEAAALDSL